MTRDGRLTIDDLLHDAHFVVPHGIVTIAPPVMWACRSMTHVWIPDSVVEIQDWSFAGCVRLKVASIGPDTIVQPQAFPDDCVVERRTNTN